MKNLKKIIIGSVAATTLVIAATALADRGSDRHERMVERISSKLALDVNQDEALAMFVSQLSETRALLRGPTENIGTQLGELVGADTFDQGKALSMINERAAALQNKAPEIVAAAAVFFDGLDAEQKAQIQEFAEKGHRGRHRH